MKSNHGLHGKLAVAVAGIVIMAVSSVRADVIAPLALPGGASNVLAGSFGNRNDHVQGGGDYNIWTNAADDDVASTFGSGTGGPTYMAIFATPAHTYTGIADTLGAFGAMTLIRIYANQYPDDNPSWYILPTTVTIKDDFTANNDQNSYWIEPGNFATTVVTDAALVWTASGLATGQYYADVAVNIPAGTNALFFDFGTPAGQGGYQFAEFQGADVPEPATLTLGCLGGLLLCVRRGRTG